MDHRAFARKLANESLSQGKPLEWFELLYGAAADAPAAIPWADQRVNPNLHEWLQRSSIARRDATALVVGCGLGDDAEFLQGHGFVTTAFDVAPSAIAWCQQRFPDSAVKYCVADLFDPPREWFNSFDLVVEIYTLQVLPAELRRQAMESMAPWVRPCGRLLVITRGRDESDDPGQMPWPLLRQELNRLVDCGLTLAQFDDYFDDEDPPVRRFRCEFRR